MSAGPAAGGAAPAGEETANQIRGSSVLLGGRLIAMAVNIGTQVLLVRGLTKVDYGTFAYALSIVTFARIVVGLGHNQAVTRFLSIYEERRDWDKLFGTMVMMTGTVLGTGSVLYLVLWLARGPLGDLVVDAPGAYSVILVVVLLAPIQVLDDTFEGAFAVFSRPRSIFFRKYLIAPGLRFAVVLALVLLGAGVRFLATGYVVAAAAGVAFYAVTLAGMLRARGLARHFRWRSLSFPFRAYFGFSVPLLTSEVLYLSLTTVGVVVLGYHAGAAEVAEFRAIRPAALLNQLAFSSFLLLFRPLAARLHERGDTEGLAAVYWQTAVWLAVCSVPVVAMTVPFAEQTTVMLFGDDYRAAGPYLAVLSLGYYLNAALGFNTLVLQIFERIRYVVVANLVATAVDLALTLWLVPSVGAMGAAVANMVALVGLNLASQVGLGLTTGIALVPPGAARVYGSVAVTVAALWLVDVTLEPPFLAALGIAAVASAALLAANRSRLDVGATFPEVRRLPVVGRLLS